MDDLGKRRRRRGFRRRTAALAVSAVLFAGIAFVVEGDLSRHTDILERLNTRLGSPIQKLSRWLPEFSAESTVSTGSTGSTITKPRPPTHDTVARVLKVLDGDTLEVVDGTGDVLRIRLHGIDAPERDQRHGAASRRALSWMVFGRKIGLDIRETDRYGRQVAVAFRADLNVNEEMIRRGHAWWYRRYAPGASDFERAEDEARDDRRGLWRDSNPIPPWNWRHR